MEQERVARHIGTVEECEFERMKEPYVTTGYRVGYDVGTSVWSALEWHNETLNIWTHFLGVVAGVCLLCHTYRRVVPAGRSVHAVLPLFLFVPALGSMASSTLFHVFRSISEPVYAAMAPLDFFFIALEIVGTQVPLIYYSLYERPALRRRYFAALALMLAAAVAYIAVPALILPALRALRTTLFVLIAVVAVAARTHARLTWRTYPAAAQRVRETAPLAVTAYALALLAVVLYLFRFPERYWPATFDHTLQSHILMHLLSMAAETLLWRVMVHDIRAVTAASPKRKTN